MRTSGKSRKPIGDSTKHLEVNFTLWWQNVWSSTGQQLGLTYFHLDKEVIDGLLPLNLKAEQEAAYFKVTRLGKANHLKDQNFDPKDFESKISMAVFHPASFDLENCVSFDHIFNTDEPINIYTDDSKIDDRTGCAFCVRENNISTSQWMTQLKPHNSVFQAELIAINEACAWASQSNQPFNIWTDSECSLHSISSLKISSPLAQDIQSILLNSPNIKLGWMWDVRVTRQRILSQRKVPWKGSQHNIQYPRASSKRNFMAFPPNSGTMSGTTATLEGTPTLSFQRSRLPQNRGNDHKSCSEWEMAHSQLTLRYLDSELPIVVLVASWDPLCTSHTGAALQAHKIFTSPQTTLNISGGKESSTTH
ncbi:hypothetical protein AVEN_258194-1 [Araneus ventricosus]|uniref:RNase H type-1 domain-containing protein n=1 Tax=Araneus ventricosus TaxID=182803 RepID=A0A4Y2SE98_ARAVE|nr:hypothetical protein AVEN_258194-1 [Araneus ventricosus]